MCLVVGPGEAPKGQASPESLVSYDFQAPSAAARRKSGENAEMIGDGGGEAGKCVLVGRRRVVTARLGALQPEMAPNQERS
jgi:hypothetical protein